MSNGCEAGKRGPGNTYRTPCGKEPNPRDCANCSEWSGQRENIALGTRGGETPMQSYAWRKLKWRKGIPSGDN